MIELKQMNGRTFFDTNVLVYAVHPTDPKGEVVRSLLLSASVVFSVQVLNEFVNVARRKLKRDWQEVKAAIDILIQLCPEPNPITLTTHTLGVNIAKRYRYSIYDGLILASATESACTLLYSEDLKNGQRIGAVTIKNPFVTV